MNFLEVGATALFPLPPTLNPAHCALILKSVRFFFFSFFVFFFFGPESPARSLIWLRPSAKPPASQRSGQIKDSALALARFRVKKEKRKKK